MRRLLALSLLASAAVVGCGPVAPTSPATGPAGATPSPTLSVGEAKPTVAARKTWTREQIEQWWQGDGRKRMTMAEVKAAIGPPDTTKEFQVTGAVMPSQGMVMYETLSEWTYTKLTVDAKGSEKVDSFARFHFYKDGQQTWRPVLFVP